MKVAIGQRVRTRDGHDVGTIRYVILDPATREVRAVVVEGGGLLSRRAVEVPPELLATAPEDLLHLDRNADELGDLRPFDEERYTTPPDDDEIGTVYPVANVLWPAPPPSAPGYVGGTPVPAGVVRVEDEKPAPEERVILAREARENAVIGQGDRVVSSDGGQVGSVARVAFEPSSGQPVTLTVERGLLGKDEVDLSWDEVASVDDHAVTLKASQEEFEQLARARRSH